MELNTERAIAEQEIERDFVGEIGSEADLAECGHRDRGKCGLQHPGQRQCREVSRDIRL